MTETSSDHLSGEALNLIIGLLEGKLVGTNTDIQIRLKTRNSRNERVRILKKFIEENQIVDDRFTQQLAEYHIDRNT